MRSYDNSSNSNSLMLKTPFTTLCDDDQKKLFDTFLD